METMRNIITAIAALLISTIATGAEIERPGLSDNPRTYLKEFPLDVVEQDELIEAVGAPDKSSSVGDTTYVTYNISKTDTGTIEYTFIIKGGKVVNVKYLNAGNFFGLEQKEDARKLQSK